MKPVTKKITVLKDKKTAFDNFVNRLKEWWPREYTWSQDKLADIRITPGTGGLCTEIGPHNFRCDWGRGTAFEEHCQISFTWQISPKRVPEPDPNKASQVTVKFVEKTESEIEVELIHADFQNHGNGVEAYQQAMESPDGWDFLLARFAAFCKHDSQSGQPL